MSIRLDEYMINNQLLITLHLEGPLLLHGKTKNKMLLLAQVYKLNSKACNSYFVKPHDEDYFCKI